MSAGPCWPRRVLIKPASGTVRNAPAATAWRRRTRSTEYPLPSHAGARNRNPWSTFAAADGDGYELNMGRWSRHLAQRFLDFTGLSEGEQVLDVGRGTGHLAAAVAGRVASVGVRGVDISPVYVDHTKAHHPDPRVSFEVGDAFALSHASGTFDRVLSLLVLHFVPNWRAAIPEMRRVAKPGATVAATVWDARGGFVANRLFFDTAAALDPRAGERRAKNFTRPLTRPGELAAA